MGFSSQRNHDPEKEAQLLKRRFGRITRRFERTQKARRLYRSLRYPLLILLVVGGSAGAMFALSPWPPLMTLWHAASFAGCDAARAVGLAPAVKGRPGYWQRLDPNRTGWSCEQGRS